MEGNGWITAPARRIALGEDEGTGSKPVSGIWHSGESKYGAESGKLVFVGHVASFIK